MRTPGAISRHVPRGGLAPTLCAALAGVTAMAPPAEAGLYWDAAVARQAQLLTLCAEFAGGRDLASVAETVTTDGPLVDEITTERTAESLRVTFAGTIYAFGTQAGPRVCDVRSVADVPDAALRGMVQQGFLTFRDQIGDGVLDGGARVRLPDGPIIEIRSRLGNVSSDLPPDLLVEMRPTETDPDKTE